MPEVRLYCQVPERLSVLGTVLALLFLGTQAVWSLTWALLRGPLALAAKLLLVLVVVGGAAWYVSRTYLPQTPFSVFRPAPAPQSAPAWPSEAPQTSQVSPGVATNPFAPMLTESQGQMSAVQRCVERLQFLLGKPRAAVQWTVDNAPAYGGSYGQDLVPPQGEVLTPERLQAYCARQAG